MEIDDIGEKLDGIENKLNVTISNLEGKAYNSEIKQKKIMEQWLGLLYQEFKKELKKTKQEIIKEIKNDRNKR